MTKKIFYDPHLDQLFIRHFEGVAYVFESTYFPVWCHDAEYICDL